MIEYRTFRNTDPPHLAAIWRTEVGRAWAQPMSADLLDRFVFSRPYFDRQGLIVATREGIPVGFSHAGFGSSENGQTLVHDLGVTCVVLARTTDPQADEIRAGLLERSEAYLRHQGAEVVYGGCIYPLNPFYFGLYGGSELPGILDSDVASRRLYEQANYQVADRVIVLQKDLHGFRVPMDRRHLQARRATRTDTTPDPPPSTWWEACTSGPFPRQCHTLVRKSDNQTIAAATWRGMEPLSIGWGVNAVGLIHIEVAEEFRRQGYGSYLLNEVFSHLHSTGATVVETQTMERNAGALAFYEMLGFQQIDSGVIYRKTGGNGKVT